MSKEYYYEEKDFKLIQGDSFKILKGIEPKSIDMIFADPPYFLSSDGISCSGGKMVSVNKGDWDKSISIEEKHKFNRKWIKLCYQILKDDGTIWISGTMHNIYSIGMALEQEGFKIINNITWKKLNPPPNISCRFFVHSTETILWAKKGIKTAKTIYDKHRMISEFLTCVLKVDSQTAEIDACRIEHTLSHKTIKSIENFLKTKNILID